MVTRLRPDLCSCVYTFTVLPDGTEQLEDYEQVCPRHQRVGMVAMRHAAIVEESVRFNRVVERLNALFPNADLPIARMRDDDVLEVTAPISEARKTQLRSALASRGVTNVVIV